MGIFEWVKSQTGVWGPALLELYFQNAWWLNTLLVAYGVLLLLAWRNLSRVGDSLTAQILEQAGEKAKPEGKDESLKPLRLSDFTLSWESALAAGRFPFVAKQTGILIHRTGLEKVRTLITERDLIQLCARPLEQLGFRLEPEK